MSTLSKWMNKGLRLPNGKRLRLARRRVAGRVYTDEESLREFLATMEQADVDRFIDASKKATSQQIHDRAETIAELAAAKVRERRGRT